MKKTKNGIFSSVLWRFGERICAQFVSAIVSIILARILVPEDYGLVAIVAILISVFNAFVVGGFGNSLIQKKDADQLDFSSMFYFSLVFSLVIYAVIFFTAEPISALYKNASLIPIIRVMGIRVPFAAINSIQQAYLSKKMEFKKFFFSTLIGTIVSAFIGVFLAIRGYGPWALVFQFLSNVAIDTIVLFAIGGWRPSLSFSFSRVKRMFGFGFKMMCASVVDTAFNEARSAVISLKYSPTDLAYYDNGKKYPLLFITNINTSIGSVMFPAFSNIQDEKSKFKELMRKSLKISVFIMAPILFGFASIGNRFINVVLTEKWSSCLPFIYATCAMGVFYPLHTINIQALNSIGRSGKALVLEIIKKTLNIGVLVVTMFYGPVAIAMGSLIVSFLSTFINGIYAKKYFDYSIIEQLLDVLPSLLLSFMTGILVSQVDNLLCFNGWIILFADVLIGALFYIAVSFVFNYQPLVFVFLKAKTIFRK